jgi:hypothetical protein
MILYFTKLVDNMRFWMVVGDDDEEEEEWLRIKMVQCVSPFLELEEIERGTTEGLDMETIYRS